MERVGTQWHQNDTHASVLERQDESLDERNAPVLANGAEAGCDPLAITPVLERAAPELLALVADDGFRGDTGSVNGAFEEGVGRLFEGPATRLYDGVVGQCDRMEYRRLNAALPALGKMDPWWLRFGEHRDLRKLQ